MNVVNSWYSDDDEADQQPVNAVKQHAHERRHQPNDVVAVLSPPPSSPGFCVPDIPPVALVSELAQGGG